MRHEKEQKAESASHTDGHMHKSPYWGIFVYKQPPPGIDE